MARIHEGPHAPTVALPESRQLDVMARLLERRGATILRCPMVAIKDTPDSVPVVGWLQRFIAETPDLLIAYTGEGIDRLIAFAERAGLDRAFVEALGRTKILVRGPKPARSLSRLGVKPTLSAVQPTTEGVIATLDEIGLKERRVAVQLYGADPNDELMAYLESQGVKPDCVAPYVYASHADDEQVVELINSLCAGKLDAIAFTSKTQVDRLRKVATRERLSDALDVALNSVVVAAVGPVVAAELARAGVRVDVMPDRSYFMKPLVTRLMQTLGTTR